MPTPGEAFVDRPAGRPRRRRSDQITALINCDHRVAGRLLKDP
jgi:hypothetical protein